MLNKLAHLGAVVGVLDPHVPHEQLARHGFEVVVSDQLDATEPWDLAVVLTDHDLIDFEAVADRVGRVFDTRGVYRRRGIEHDGVVAL